MLVQRWRRIIWWASSILLQNMCFVWSKKNGIAGDTLVFYICVSSCVRSCVYLCLHLFASNMYAVGITEKKTWNKVKCNELIWKQMERPPCVFQCNAYIYVVKYAVSCYVERIKCYARSTEMFTDTHWTGIKPIHKWFLTILHRPWHITIHCKALQPNYIAGTRKTQSEQLEGDLFGAIGEFDIKRKCECWLWKTCQHTLKLQPIRHYIEYNNLGYISILIGPNKIPQNCLWNDEWFWTLLSSFFISLL